eukprot:gnl/Hemi2/5605_TR1923_c0_g1_i1.p3 gnl/Hemi2/5605_TR1923_c0_g1~~gnl/Hemi2/5605_TR1923_c0_g1_i1.p3  ORF type:complete len:153 (-),score=31.97 gnl/Hemi2/5605_TR1923_c0_g1_i1:165-623(-)
MMEQSVQSVQSVQSPSLNQLQGQLEEKAKADGTPVQKRITYESVMRFLGVVEDGERRGLLPKTAADVYMCLERDVVDEEDEESEEVDSSGGVCVSLLWREAALAASVYADGSVLIQDPRQLSARLFEKATIERNRHAAFDTLLGLLASRPIG